jgi:hypothetical protein
VRGLALIVLALLATPAGGQSREVLGYAGVLGEWELTATVTQTSSWWGQKFSGPLTMKHVGTCTQDGREVKMGDIQLQLSPFSSRVQATISIAGEACTLSVDASPAAQGAMSCPGRRPVPLTLWLK